MEADKPKHYFPSNGTEGMVFMSMWCESCTKDTMLRGGKTYCTILTNSMVKPPPVKQWIYDEENRPICTSFKQSGMIKKRKIRKSEQTIDMFHNGKKLTDIETELLGFHAKINY